MKDMWTQFRRMPVWGQIVVRSVTGLAVLGAIGCGGDDGSSKDSATQSTTTQESCTTQLTVSRPKSGSTVHADKIRVKGRTDPGAQVEFTLSAAAEDYGGGGLRTATSSGSFRKTLDVHLGKNTFHIDAQKAGCDPTQKIVTVRYRRTAAQLAAIRQKREEDRARREAERQQRIANYKANAQTIDYRQLSKNPDDYKGTTVKYRGQIFQIQEDQGSTGLLLSVTDEGYGFWDDNIWVDYDGEIASAEDDIITIYGKVTGTETYETQIGGETYVPRVRAKYIEE